MPIQRLLIMRHAKSSWKTPGITDEQRPLNDRGIAAAGKMAKFLSDEDLIPDLIVASSAVRAKATCELMLEDWNKDVAVEFLESLYLAASQTYLESIARIATDQKTVMTIGHNPGLEMLVSQLSNSYTSMPTAAIAVFEIDSEWGLITPKKCRMAKVYRPKEIVHD